GLQHYGATSTQRRPGLAGDHCQGKIPRSDTRNDADGLFDDDDSLVRLMLWNGVAVNALGFFAEPFEKGRGIGDFAFRFREWLALLDGHEAGEIFLVGHHKVEPAAKNGGAFLGGFLAPSGESAVSGFDSLPGFSAT